MIAKLVSGGLALTMVGVMWTLAVMDVGEPPKCSEEIWTMLDAVQVLIATIGIMGIGGFTALIWFKP